MRLNTFIIFWAIFLLCNARVWAQNYVTNPSFENITGCPDVFFQIYKSPPWFSPDCVAIRPDAHGYAVLFTSVTPCTNPLTGVPQSTAWYLEAHKGFSYAAIIVFSSNLIHFTYRQYLAARLKQRLEAGKTYYFSMFYGMAKAENLQPGSHFCLKTDSLGVYFSKDSLGSNPLCTPLQVKPQLTAAAATMISDDGKWKELTGCYTAKGGEEFITLGNYASNELSYCDPVDTLGFYISIDDVTVTPKVVKQVDTMLCAGKTLTINAQKFRAEYLYLDNWQYKWDDGIEGKNRGLSLPGKYILRVTKDCFEDVYTFNITNGDCTCHDYTPTAFTPNGDNINDRFSPYIVCDAGEVTDYKFSVYNRWGQRLFYSANARDKWDGTFSGSTVPAGSYVYMVHYKSKAGAADEFKTVKGMVTVIR